MQVDHKICVTDNEVAMRITIDRAACNELWERGYPVKTIAAWQSPLTFECHAMPIFNTDTWQDVCNRYFDLFPKEAALSVKEIENHNAALDQSGFSADKTLFMMGKVPKGLEKFLDCWHPKGDFWRDKVKRKAFFSYFKKFKVGKNKESHIVTG